MERQLPQSIEAEQSVLGSILIDPEAILQVVDFLRVDDFYRDAHRVIYRAMITLLERNEPSDYLMLIEELERTDKLDDVGGSAYVTSLVNGVPTSGNVEYYGHIVERKAQYRQLVKAAGMIVQYACDEDVDAVSKSEELIHMIAQGKRIARLRSLKDALADYMVKLDKIHENRGKTGITGVPTGFKTIDQVLGGLQRSDLITLAARPAQGKTSLVLNIAEHIVTSSVTAGLRVLMFSLEMSQEQLAQRMVSMKSGVDQTKLRTGWIEDNEWENIIHAFNELSTEAMQIDDTPGISLIDMRSRARRMQSEQGLDLVLVDYMQLMRGSLEAGKYENRTQEVSAISRGLKELARELNVPVLALAQLNRAVEQRADKVPQLSDLKESGSIEQDSDVVMFIHKDPETEEKDNGCPLNIIVAKHRNGPTGFCPLWFTPHLTRFSDIEDVFNVDTGEIIP